MEKNIPSFNDCEVVDSNQQDNKMEASSSERLPLKKKSIKEEIQKAREALGARMKYERKTCFHLKGLLGPVVVVKDPPPEGGHVKVSKKSAASSGSDEQLHTVVRVNKEMVQEAGGGQRVVSISDTSGSTLKDAIILTQELSSLKKDGIESTLKHDNDDIEKKQHSTALLSKTQPENEEERGTTTGLVKAFISNVHNCTIMIECKIISGTIEVSRCSNVVICIHREATVPTLQLDLCKNVTIDFKDALSSNKNNHVLVLSPPADSTKTNNDKSKARYYYWGEDPADRIYHAGVKNMMVRIWRDGFLEKEHKADFIKDGAQRIGRASKEEFQFITSVVNDRLLTEKVVKAEKGLILRPMTQRELDAGQTILNKSIAEAMMTAGSGGIRIMSKREFESQKK